MLSPIRVPLLTLSLAFSAFFAQTASAAVFCEVLGGAPGCYASTEECTSVRCGFDTGAACDCICTAATAEQCPDEPAGGAAFEPIELDNPLGVSDTRVLIARGIQLITGVAGSIALLMFVWGGFMWITAGGNADTAKKAKGVFVNAVYGLLLIFGAYAIINALLSAFAGAA